MNGFALIGIAVTLWSVGSGIIAKLFTVPALMWYPVAAAMGAAVVVVIILIKESPRSLWPQSTAARWLLLGVGVTVLINNGLFFTALQITSVPVAQLTHYLAPLFLAVIFAPLMLGEKPTKREVILTLVGLLGLSIVLWPDLRDARLSVGAMMGAISAVFFALGNVFNRKLTAYGVSGLPAAAYQNFIPTLGMAPFMLWQLNQGVQFTSGDIWGAVYMGVMTMGFGFSLFLFGLQRLKKANHAGIMSYGEPIGAIILAAIFLHEPMTAYVIVGGILIIGSGVALVLGKD